MQRRLMEDPCTYMTVYVLFRNVLGLFIVTALMVVEDAFV